MADWNPAAYLSFAAERTRPAADLAARVPVAAPARVADLGCGPGNSTAVLRAKWPAAEVVGVDNSPAMLADAAKAHPAGLWVLADIANWAGDGRPFDVVFSNAALHWVPNHAALFPRLLGLVAPGGALAVQMPAVNDTPLHRLLNELAARPAWADRFRGMERSAVESPGFYYDALRPHAAALDLWVTEYQHELADPAAVVAWARSTALRPFLDRLPDPAAFEAELLAGVGRAFPRRAGGRVLFPFRRLFLVATK